jgi:hypothetical protein
MNSRQRISAETPPRLVPTLALKGESCAAALDISPGSFRALVEEGLMPKPVTIPGHAGLVLWDFEAVRNAWQALLESGGDGKGNPWDKD